MSPSQASRCLLHTMRAARPVRVVRGPWHLPRRSIASAVPTIYALATGPPPSAISIVRIAGYVYGTYMRPLAKPLGDAMTRTHEWVPRQLVKRTLRHPCTREILDEALLAYFPPGQSFSGDATLELHLHGSPAVVRDVLAALTDARALFGSPLRPAMPGEFTRRAFEQGRLDLTACEALDALLHAETSAQRRLAQQAGGGRQAQLYEDLRTKLLRSMAHLEAMLDFSDEDDIDARLWDSVRAQVADLRAYLAKELQLDVPAAQRSYVDAAQHGVRVALYGRPNVGKSSLLNQLVRRDAAIVSSHPGTTRDIIEVSMELGGFRVTLADTAGLRETHDEVEQLGMQRTHSTWESLTQCTSMQPIWPCSFARRTTGHRCRRPGPRFLRRTRSSASDCGVRPAPGPACLT